MMLGSNEPSLTELIFATRAKAGDVRRRSDGVLYSVLADCLHAVERCKARQTDREELRLLFAQRPIPSHKKRTYVERGSDEFQIVCRLVFAQEMNSANTNRYAITIRQAFERGIRASDLVAWLGKNGGINELYLSRPLDANVVETKCLRLRAGIVVRKGVPFTLTLVRRENNSYDILSKS